MLPAEMLDEGQADFFVRELVQKLVSGLGGSKPGIEVSVCTNIQSLRLRGANSIPI